jgi:hypothetical protein
VPCCLLSCMLGLLILSCVRGSEPKEQESLVGQITELHVEDGLLTAISLADESGRIETFRLHPVARRSADVSHLEVHKQLRVPVRLLLRNDGEGLLVVAIGY